MVLFIEVSFEHSYEGMGGLKVVDVRRERIPVFRKQHWPKM